MSMAACPWPGMTLMWEFGSASSTASAAILRPAGRRPRAAAASVSRDARTARDRACRLGPLAVPAGSCARRIPTAMIARQSPSQRPDRPGSENAPSAWLGEPEFLRLTRTAELQAGHDPGAEVGARVRSALLCASVVISLSISSQPMLAAADEGDCGHIVPNVAERVYVQAIR